MGGNMEGGETIKDDICLALQQAPSSMISAFGSEKQYQTVMDNLERLVNPDIHDKVENG
jgi:hypothetical protein